MQLFQAAKMQHYLRLFLIAVVCVFNADCDERRMGFKVLSHMPCKSNLCIFVNANLGRQNLERVATVDNIREQHIRATRSRRR